MIRAAAGLAVLAALGTAGCAPEQTSESSATLALEPCPPQDLIEDGQCGVLEVWEDRDAQSGRRIGLRIVVLPALSGSPAPDPVFILAGGPGQAATELVEAVRGALRSINRQRDLVFVDQRGTGQSNPLTCDLDEASSEDEELILDPMADSILRERSSEVLRTCAAELDADPRLYTTPIAMDDLDEVRQALGYETINLWGGSYGTRAALIYMRRHPESTRTAVLDGVAPVALRLPVHMGIDGSRALGLLFDDCEASAECSAAFPGIRDEFTTVLDRLEAQAVVQEMDHPITGEAIEVPVTRTSFASLIRNVLYSADLAALLPLAIHEAHEGDYQTIAAMGISAGAAAALNTGMFLSVACAEDVRRITDDDRERAAEDFLLRTDLIDSYSHLCDSWPEGELPDGYGDPVTSDRPVLLTSGVLDPVTPPRWAEYAEEHLSNSLHIAVPGTGHGTLAAGCVPDLIEEFLDSGSPEGLDVSCVDEIERPEFFDTPLGPGTRSDS